MNKAIVTTVASATMMALAGAASAADNCQGGSVDSTGLCAYEGAEAKQVSSGGDTSFGNFEASASTLATRLQSMEQATQEAHDRADTGVQKANNARNRADYGVSRANTGVSRANGAQYDADVAKDMARDAGRSDSEIRDIANGGLQEFQCVTRFKGKCMNSEWVDASGVRIK